MIDYLKKYPWAFRFLYWLTPFKFIVGFFLLALAQVLIDRYIDQIDYANYAGFALPAFTAIIAVLALVDWVLCRFFSRKRAWTIQLGIIAAVIFLYEYFGG